MQTKMFKVIYKLYLKWDGEHFNTFDLSGGTLKDLLKWPYLTGNNLKIMESETQKGKASSTGSPATTAIVTSLCPFPN